jgi:hypothetical protein
MPKYLIVLLITVLLPIMSWAQGGRSVVLGQYEQDQYIGPDEVDAGETDVVITPDPRLTKVIYINNLLKGGPIKAVLFTGKSSAGDNLIFSIPAQKVGDYLVKLGCVVYDEDGRLIVSLNNKANCYGMSNADYGNVKIGKDGSVQAGDTRIGKGGIKTPGVDIGSDGNLSVDAKTVMAGVQYIGNKVGAPVKKEADNDR